jgi:septum formation protein
MRVILASGSPRRAEILREAGIPFELLSAPVSEARNPGEDTLAFVRRLAESKVKAAAARIEDEAILIGADTEVLVDGLVLGKPTSAEQAREMLRRLSGRTHEVITAVALLRQPDGLLRLEHELTRVTFAVLSADEIAAYVAGGEPFDKAGGYAIQGRGGRFVKRIEGDYFNVVGLPLARVVRMLRELGWRD